MKKHVQAKADSQECPVAFKIVSKSGDCKKKTRLDKNEQKTTKIARIYLQYRQNTSNRYYSECILKHMKQVRMVIRLKYGCKESEET